MGEMEYRHWLQRQRQRQLQESSPGRRRGRERVYQVGGGAAAARMRRTAAVDLRPRLGFDTTGSMGGGAHREGYDELRKQRDASNIALDSSYSSGSETEENSFTLKFGQSPHKRSNRLPTKMLIDEDMSEEIEMRRSSPSVIAKLMGLDELPPPKVVQKQQKEIGSCFQKPTSAGCGEKFLSCGDHFLQMRASENKEFKDVFEVMETLTVEEDKYVCNGAPRIKQHETEVNFIKQRFKVVKHLSSDEAHRSAKKFSDDLKVFDSDKHIQKPNLLFTKNLHDLKCSPSSPCANHITILKSSNISKYEGTEGCRKSDGVAESCNMQKDALSYCRKPPTGLPGRSLYEQSSSRSHRLSKSQYIRNNDTCLHTNEIVVLKPSLEKAQNVVRTVPLPRNTDNLAFSHRRLQQSSPVSFPRNMDNLPFSHRRLQRSGVQELHPEGRVCQKYSECTEVLRHNTKSSREIAQQIRKQMQGSNVRSGDKKASVLEFGGHTRDESSRIMSGLSKLHNFEACLRSSDHCNNWIGGSTSSSTYSTEVSSNREARKHMSNQWTNTHQFKEAGHVHSGASSLREMFALSDRETHRTTLNSQTIHKVSDEMFAPAEVPVTWCCPSNGGTRASQKDEHFVNIPNSISHPGSSTDGNPNKSERDRTNSEGNCHMLKDVLNLTSNDASLRKLKPRGTSVDRSLKSNKPKSFNVVGEENKLPVHVNLEEPGKNILLKVAEGAKANELDISNNSMTDAAHLIGNLSAFEHMDRKMPFMPLQDLTSNVAPRKDDDFCGNDQNNLVMEVTSDDLHQEDCIPIYSVGTEPGSPASPKAAQQPSPVCVLDLPSSKEKSTDLLSDKDIKGECHSLQQKGDILLEFRDEEERDFSYLLDILIDSGVYSVAQDRLHNACYSPEYPVDPGLFGKLEKKHNKLVTWSKSERKLLFDLTNCSLAEILAPRLDLHPWVKSNERIGPMWGCEGLVEKVWLMLARQQKGPSIVIPDEKFLDSMWLVLGDDIDIMGREIERMLKDDLLEELISEFILG